MKRNLMRFWAWFCGYFAAPCPLCAQEFYGFQSKRCGHIPHPDGTPGKGLLICPTCTRKQQEGVGTIPGQERR